MGNRKNGDDFSRNKRDIRGERDPLERRKKKKKKNKSMETLRIEGDMETLGIEGDMKSMFMTYHPDAFKEETCHFLATPEHHGYEESPFCHINFSVRGYEYSLPITTLDRIFGFPQGSEPCPDFD